MKKRWISAAAVVLCAMLLPRPVLAAESLIPVGRVIGLELQDDSVMVAGFDEKLSKNAKKAGLKVGDEILKVDDTPVDSTEDVRNALQRCTGDVELLVERDGKERKLTMVPRETGDGKRLGVYLRQGIAGIGTVTYYDPDTGSFGALGHGVNNAKGKILTMTAGNAYDGRVQSVTRGKVGAPGQLKGAAASHIPVAELSRNTPQGIFGKTAIGWLGKPVPVGAFEDVKTGAATIRSTVNGEEPQEYSVEILKIYPKERKDNRNFLIRVTDPELLKTTGGIVQGMSGSPIIQDGKLIGAVTHVLVNDPTTGYGIYIENMLDAAA